MYSACHSILAEIQGASPIDFEGSVGMDDTIIAKKNTSINGIHTRALLLLELEIVCVLHTPV